MPRAFPQRIARDIRFSKFALRLPRFPIILACAVCRRHGDDVDDRDHRLSTRRYRY